MATAKQATPDTDTTREEELVNAVVDDDATVAPARAFTIAGRDPFDEVEWEIRDALIPGRNGPAFEQREVEFPKFWSQTATNIVAQKYFRGRMASPERERSVKQMIGRIVDTIGGWGRAGGYFATDEEADTFEAELKAILVNQIASFNSPVWFNVGFEETPQCSACQPYDALVSTPRGLVPIGRLVDEDAVGHEVYDANGVTQIVAVKANGRKEVFRITLRNGNFVEATADHVVKAVRERRGAPAWLKVEELELGMRMHLHPHRAKVAAEALAVIGGGGWPDEPSADEDPQAIAEAALAGWLQADGFVGQYDGTNRSLTLEFMVANDDEHRWITDHLDTVFPDVHRHERDVVTQDPTLSCRRIRLYGEGLRPFVEAWGLLARGTEIRVPARLWTASHAEVCAYLRSVFQADGYVTVHRSDESERARIAFAVIGEQWAEDIQLLLNVVGIYSRRIRKQESRADRHDLHEVQISIGSERARFAELIGFPGTAKHARLLESLDLRGIKSCPDLREEEIVSIESVGVHEVYDIQTESGEYLSNNVAVHNCFILSIEDSMESILDWIRREGIIFRGGSGSGLNLSRLRSSKEQLSKGGFASGPVSFMRGADASAGTIKSGGKTRRAAKMVVLDVDHPDVEEFVWCKAREERKARVLEAAGYDMSLDSPDWASIQYQNANNSVRVTDAFMEAVVEGREWGLTARTDGSVIETVDARGLLKDIAAAAWECADPGVQYDTTINAWHTSPNTGRINASNPCFPGDARVHTTLGLLPIEELYDRAADGEEVRVYTHHATGDEPGEGVAATTPLAVMRNGIAPILRLRFSDGRELRCTPNHRLWTTNRGYVPAEELTSDDLVRLNDAQTTAEDAAWELPVRVREKARSFARGGSVVEQGLPDRWSEGLAELTGHLVGDGWLTDVQTGWVYGGDDIADGLAASHEGLLRELVGGASVQEMGNGTRQLRVGSEAVRELFRGLGVTSHRAADKRVPASVFTAPPEMQAAFLRGLFGADGCVSRTENGKASRYVGLGSRSEALLRDVQRLLSAFGVRGRIYAVSGSAGGSFSYTRVDGETVTYESGQGYDLRITGSDLDRFADAVGFSAPRKQAALVELLRTTTRYDTKPGVTLIARENDGQEMVYNLNEPLNHSYIVDGVLVANCSEYMHVDDSACNLASLNLLKFRKDDGELDVPMFEHAVDVMFLAQEIIVGYSSYPTPEIGRNAKRFRQLGLGYANLGALLMARGLPYDSDEGRAYAAAITALMTGRAYRKSAEVARRMGPHAGYQQNRAAMVGVIAKHRAAVGNIDHAHSVPADLLDGARRAWDDALEIGEVHGFRNAQATVLAPTGTISFMMDCDTTGVEPDFSLVKSKKLVGGGDITIVNKTVPMALRELGYAPTEVEEIVAFIDERGGVVGAPHLKSDHYPVFDCAIGERSIHYMGHVKMMGAVQPFISGAISKCVTAETLVSTAEGLVRIGSMHRGEPADAFRAHRIPVVSLDGVRETDAFYYGGERETIEVKLASGHRVTGTPNHRLLIATSDGGLDWRALAELEPGDHVATQYGADLWAAMPAPFDDFSPTERYGSQKPFTIPAHMSDELAFFLGAYAAEGHISRTTHTVRIANTDEGVIDRLVTAGRSLFGLTARVARYGGKCPSVELSSKTLVEFLDHLGCGATSHAKRIPDAVLRSPRSMVLAFLEGLSLDSYIPASLPKWAICLASNDLLDDLQAVLTNLGIVHNRITKHNAEYDRFFDEVYAHGRHAQRLFELIRFPEAHKQTRAEGVLAREIGPSHSDLIPGLTGSTLYDLIPRGRSGRAGAGTGKALRFRHLVDPRTSSMSRASLEEVATLEAVELPDWLTTVLDCNLHFSPVEAVAEVGLREVYDISVPVTHAFVGNGIVNHNTVNLPEQTTVDEVAQLLIESWRLGVKAIAIYRDNCKVAQPLSGSSADKVAAALLPTGATGVVAHPQRRRLPDDRTEVGRKFKVGEYEGYIHVGLFEDGTPGDIFVDIAKEGTTLAGLMNSFMISVSLGLQYGVPLEVYVSKFSHMRFEPSGLTNDADIRVAKSIVDYIFRWMGKKFLSADQQEEAGILTAEVKARLAAAYSENPGAGLAAAAVESAPPGQTALFNQWEDAVECAKCGGRMVRTGSCYTCRDCGTNTGCS